MPQVRHPGYHRLRLRLDRRCRVFQTHQQARHHQHQNRDPAGHVDHVDERTVSAREKAPELHGAVRHDDQQKHQPVNANLQARIFSSHMISREKTFIAST